MNSVDEYIAQFEPEIQSKLLVIRSLFFQVIPNCEESIRYKMPAYKVGKHHLYFTAYKHHIGFYPVYGLPEIEEEIALYRGPKTKDSLHFKHNQPMPEALVKRIIQLKSELK